MCVRHYGLLANRTRVAKLTRCRELLGVAPPLADPAPVPNESLADTVQRLLGLGITRCPICGHGPMQVVETLPPQPLDTS